MLWKLAQEFWAIKRRFQNPPDKNVITLGETKLMTWKPYQRLPWPDPKACKMQNYPGRQVWHCLQLVLLLWTPSHWTPTPILPLVYHPIPLNAPLHNRVGLITPSSSSKLLPLAFLSLLIHYLRKHLSFSIFGVKIEVSVMVFNLQWEYPTWPCFWRKAK